VRSTRIHVAHPHRPGIPRSCSTHYGHIGLVKQCRTIELSRGTVGIALSIATSSTDFAARLPVTLCCRNIPRDARIRWHLPDDIPSGTFVGAPSLQATAALGCRSLRAAAREPRRQARTAFAIELNAPSRASDALPVTSRRAGYWDDCPSLITYSFVPLGRGLRVEAGFNVMQLDTALRPFLSAFHLKYKRCCQTIIDLSQEIEAALADGGGTTVSRNFARTNQMSR